MAFGGCLGFSGLFFPSQPLTALTHRQAPRVPSQLLLRFLQQAEISHLLQGAPLGRTNSPTPISSTAGHPSPQPRSRARKAEPCRPLSALRPGSALSHGFGWRFPHPTEAEARPAGPHPAAPTWTNGSGVGTGGGSPGRTLGPRGECACARSHRAVAVATGRRRSRPRPAGHVPQRARAQKDGERAERGARAWGRAELRALRSRSAALRAGLQADGCEKESGAARLRKAVYSRGGRGAPCGQSSGRV